VGKDGFFKQLEYIGVGFGEKSDIETGLTASPIISNTWGMAIFIKTINILDHLR
jgi:hypothetical protein